MRLPPRHGPVLAWAFADDVLGPLVPLLSDAAPTGTRLVLVPLTALWTARARDARWAVAHAAVSWLSVALVVGQATHRTPDLVAAALLAGLAATGVLALRSATGADEARLVDRAERDPLTGLLNRRGLAGWAARQDAQWASVMVLDVDDLKGVNDSRGHAAGDEVLVAVAAALTGAARPRQVAARLGGDELAFVALGPPPATGAEMTRRVLADAEAAAAAHGASVSGGAAHGAWGPDALAGLVSAADERLLEAKRGRSG